MDIVTNQTSTHSWIIFRLSELYLNYAEALNEYDNGNADIVKYLNKIRKRNTVDMPEIPSGLNQAAMREKIRNERRVELAFEGHRFWDVRRWKELDKTAEIYGVKVVKDGAGGFKYTKFLYEKRPISDKMYFYPIPDTERYNNNNLKQNENW